MTKREIKFWREEMLNCDERSKEQKTQAQKLLNLYNLKFNEQIRDLRKTDLVKVSRFYPLVRQIIASIAFNYPKMFFSVDEEGNEGVSEVLERASTSLMNLMDVKPHVHQAIFDALFWGTGWLRVDFNPPGDDMIPPYVTNDSMHEDLTSVSRVSPAFVHVDPLCSPHKLGHARYIRERMWVPLKQLKNDPKIKNKNQITATESATKEELGFGEMSPDNEETPEEKAKRRSIENGDYVLVDRIHDRMNRKLIMFAEGVEDPIFEDDHPFIKRSYAIQTDLFGQPIYDDDGEPVLDIENSEPVPGWLVEDGFPFIPVKFDLSGDNFTPVAHLKYVEDIQYGIVESVSRRAALLKRTSRQGVVSESEVLNNPRLLEQLRRGVDGEWHQVSDVNNFKELIYGQIPPDQVNLENTLKQYEEEITRVTDLVESGATPRTATEASLIATQISVNRELMEAAVSWVYERVIRNCFQIMGDPQYTPENFLVNVSPDGNQVVRRALRSADFLWNYKITVAAGSTQPLFEQIQQDKFLQFYDRAAQRPSFDQMELDKMLASSAEVDVEKVIQSSENPEATRAAQLENDRMILQKQDVGILPDQDHRVHIQTHQQFAQNPSYQQIMQRAQQVGFDGQPTDSAAVQELKQISQMVSQHIQAHQQAQARHVQGPQSPSQPRAGVAGLEGTVRANAQRVKNTVASEAEMATDGA